MYKFVIVLLLVLLAGFLSGAYIQESKDKTIINKLKNESKIELKTLTTNIGEKPLEVSPESSKEVCGHSDGSQLLFNNVGDWCQITLLYQWDSDFGYSLTYPKDWTFQLRGAAGTNLSLHKGSEELVFIRVAHSDLNFTSYDTVEQGFERSEPEPLVDPEDKIVDKETIYIGVKKVMKLTTASGATYYLFDNGLEKDKSIYVIKITKDVSYETSLNLIKSFTPKYFY